MSKEFSDEELDAESTEEQETHEAELSQEKKRVPSGFKPIDVTQFLTAKGAQSADKELWVIRVPASFDLNTLKDQKISLSKPSELKTEAGTYKVNKVHESNETNHLAVFLTDEQGNRLQYAKPVTGQLNITRSIHVPEPVAPVVKANIVKQPKGLNYVFTPFAAQEPPVVTTSHSQKASKSSDKSSKDRKRKHAKPEAEELEPVVEKVEDTSSQERKIAKAKKKSK